MKTRIFKLHVLLYCITFNTVSNSIPIERPSTVSSSGHFDYLNFNIYLSNIDYFVVESPTMNNS